MRKLFLERFWSKVEFGPSCWIWKSATDNHGYGIFCVRQPSGCFPFKAYRLAYELVNAKEVPEGMTLDHLCRNRLCVNPAHLEVVTLAENKRRGMSPCAVHARKTHCKRGHPFSEENTYRQPSKPFGRACITCIKIKRLERKNA